MQPLSTDGAVLIFVFMTITMYEFHYFSPSLYDVCIKGEDGVSVQCHKCVLVARLEYFRSMLGSGWVEVSLFLDILLELS